MASLNVSMPDELKDFIERRTKESHFATPTEYVRALVREDQKRADRERLEKLLLEGVQGGKGIELKSKEELDAYFAKKKQALLERLKGKSK